MRPTLLALALASAAMAPAAVRSAEPPADAPPRAAARPDAPAARPNILLIVADDIGWSDLGAFGGEIATPNLDRLALAGVRFTGFHVAPTCSPTRSMLMSGVDNHEAGLGTMAEMLTPDERGRPGYEGYLNERVASIAELLRAGGYRTMMAGKWHLGLDEAHAPAARGFDRSFALLQGLGNHFGADQGPEWAKVEQATYREGLRQVPFPAGAYSTDLFADRLIGYLGEKDPAGRPFFAYLAFSAPHWPLMAPEADVATYRGRYDAGPEALRAARLARGKAMGLVPADAAAHPLVGVTPWDQLTPAQRAVEARKMEVYAAMVDHLDRRVGTVVEALRASGQLANTLVVFMGDNGPEGNRIDSPKGLTDPARLAPLHIDNSLANIGRPTSYVGYGPGWAQANSAPSWLMKGYTTEGGTRVAAFASGAGVAGGRVSQAFLHVTDVAPTLLAEAGLRQPASFGGHAILRYEGRDMAPLLAGRRDAVRGEDETVAWELFDGRAIRRGRWKAVYIAPGRSRYLSIQGRGQWQLFDLSADPGETTDLGGRDPARLAEMVTAWNGYARAKGVVLPATTLAAASPASAKPLP